MSRQPLVANEAPPAYSPPAGAAPGVPGYKGPNVHQPGPGGQSGYGTVPAGYQGNPQQPSYMQVPPGTQTVTGTYTGTVTVVHTANPDVVVVGGCPSCRIGILEEEFTCLGICCGILFFPLGLICCLLMRERRCSNCGAMFG